MIYELKRLRTLKRHAKSHKAHVFYECLCPKRTCGTHVPALRMTSHTRPRSFDSPARMHDTKRRRNEADLPVSGGGTRRTRSPKPLILGPVGMIRMMGGSGQDDGTARPIILTSQDDLPRRLFHHLDLKLKSANHTPRTSPWVLVT